MLGFFGLAAFIQLNIAVFGQVPQHHKKCGINSIPFDFRVDVNGLPEIRCSIIPTCFWRKQIFDDEASSYAYGNRRIYGTAIDQRRRHKINDDKNAECDETFIEQICSSKNEWTARIEEYNNGTNYILKTKCCRYDGLNNAATIETYSIGNGEKYIGGDVLNEDGKMIAFDLIKEVRKNVGENNEPVYLVTVTRMPCTSELAEYRNHNSQRYYDSIENGMYDPQNTQIANGYGRDLVDEYMPPSSYGRSYNRRYRPTYNSEIRRSPYHSRYQRRQYYRPRFDEYDYNVFEPMPDVRRQDYRYRPRYEPKDDDYPEERSQDFANTVRYRNLRYKPLSTQKETPTSTSFEEMMQNKNSVFDSDQQKPFQQQEEPVKYFSLPFLQPPSATVKPYTLMPFSLQQPESSNNSFSNYQPPSSLQTSLCGFVPCSSETPKPKAFTSQTYELSGQQNPPEPPQYSSADQQQLLNPQPQQQYSTSGQGYSSDQQQYSSSSSCCQQPSSSCSNCQQQSSGCSSCDLNNAMSSLQCFSSDMTVQTPSGHKRMDELIVGDMVLSIEQAMISFTPVIMFLHKDPTEVAVFKEIKTADNRLIKLTQFHLIYVTSCKMEPYKLIHAKDVNVGQCLHVVSEEDSRQQPSLKGVEIIDIREIEEAGIYAPLTASGDLMVNSVYASCHSNMGIQTLQQTFFIMYRKINVAVTSIGSMLGSYFKKEEKRNGLPFGVEYLTHFMDVLVPKSLFS